VYPRVYPRRVPPCVPPYVQGRRAREINTAIAEAFEFFGKRSANGMIVPEWVPIPDNLRWGNGRLPKFDVKARTYQYILCLFVELQEFADGAWCVPE